MLCILAGIGCLELRSIFLQYPISQENGSAAGSVYDTINLVSHVLTTLAIAPPRVGKFFENKLHGTINRIRLPISHTKTLAHLNIFLVNAT